MTLTATANADKTKTSSATISVGAAAGAVAVSVFPRRIGVTTTQTQRFTSTVAGNLNTAVNWTVDSVAGGDTTVGTIDAAGLYTPPSVPVQPGPHTVTAISQADVSACATAVAAVTDLAAVSTYHNDNARTGQNTQEYALTPASIGAGTFGKRFGCPVIGDVYAQPLYVANLPVMGTPHNVVYVATTHDAIYALDADDPACTVYWYQSLVSPTVPVATPVPVQNVEFGTAPGTFLTEIGVTGTPVISLTSGALYVVAKTLEGSSYIQRLHVFDLVTGYEKYGAPLAIQASFTSSSGSIPFDPFHHLQRSALLLDNGRLYIAFGSHSDRTPFYGWLLSYDAASLALTGVFNTAPNGSQAAIWMSGAGPAADSGGRIYVSTGNGTFDSSADYGDSLVQLNEASLAVTGSFTPSNQATLSSADLDFGSGGVVIVPDGQGPLAHPNLVLAADKQSRLFVLDRANLGGYTAGGPDNSVATIAVAPASASTGIFSTPALWSGHLYIVPAGDALKMYAFDSGLPAATATALSKETYGYQGATPSVSSQGSSNGIVWVLDTSANGTPQGNSTVGPAILRAYDATTLKLLYSSDAASGDQSGNAVKFTVPTVANGKVYVGGQGQLTVYGLLP